jgi:regulator of replication initiation timing
MGSTPQNHSQVEELAQQIRVKAMQLSDLDVMIEDYQHERTKLVQEISKLKALLWEYVGDPQEMDKLGVTDVPNIATPLPDPDRQT